MDKKMTQAQREKKWKAQGDLHTLIEAEKIKKDPARKKAALAEKGALAKELAEQAAAVAAVGAKT